METQAAIAEPVRAALDELRGRLEAFYGPRLVRLVLFGSQARGEGQLGSDIDVMVVLAPPVDPPSERARTLKDVAGVALRHGVAVCCVFVSRDDFEGQRSPLLMNVRREGVAV
jgi:predicted nucleotidyltransferase